uniref:UDP-N-acetylglucosamine transferase subunit ALG14 n=1 Tax=Xiphophorus couchianus TaxID=32473 RepID=A0A3B5MA86_9TELE
MLLFGLVFSLFLTALLFLLRVYFVLNSGSNHPPKTRSHVAVLVVAGSGGHTTEIMRLMESLSAAYTPRHYVIADTDKMSEEKIVAFENDGEKRPSNIISYLGNFTINRIPRSREVAQSWSSSVVSTLSALRYSLPLVFRLQPDVVTPETCLPGAQCTVALVDNMSVNHKVLILFLTRSVATPFVQMDISRPLVANIFPYL